MIARPFSPIRLWLTCLSLSLLCTGSHAAIRMDLNDRQELQILWDGEPVVLPSAPRLQAVGGGQRKVFNPVTREYDTVMLTAAQGVNLVVNNKKRQPVFLGNPRRTARLEEGVAIFREEFPQAGTFWEARFEPVEENGFDVTLEIRTDPGYWLHHFNLRLFDLNLDQPKGDTGNVRSRERKRDPLTGEMAHPAPDVIRLNYPDGPSMLVPAVVLQDAKLAMGATLLGAHEVWRPTYGELELRPNPERKATAAAIQSGWAHIASMENFYLSHFSKRYRFRFSRPKDLGGRPYLRLVDAEDLWKDYLEELDRRVPIVPAPAMPTGRNNILLANYMMSSPEYITPENPQGYLMNAPGWKEDAYEWPQRINSSMKEEEVARITGGFTDAHTGRPVRWIRQWAEKNVRELKETRAAAMILWRTSFDEGADTSGKASRGGQNDYVPDTHLFHPDMEELSEVEGPVRPWDWVKADIRVEDAKGNLLLEKEEVLLHAADKSRLFHIERHLDNRQELVFTKEHLREGAQEYVRQAARLGPGDRLRDKVVLKLRLEYPHRQLIGRQPGDTTTLEATPYVNDPKLAGAKLRVQVKITSVQRAVIDIWAKTLADAGEEFGFLVREDFYYGPPWAHTFRTFDWSADWQYQLLKQRIAWNRERFGEKCRWFYMDVFADYTPQFVIEMLRSDFPDCFFFIEHPQDTTVRQMQGWNWFGVMTPLEKRLNPDALVVLLPDLLLTGNESRDREIVGKLWKDPNYLLLAHRSARRLLNLAGEKITSASGADQPKIAP